MSNPYGMQGPTGLALQELQRVVGLSPSFPTVGGGLGGLPARKAKAPPPGAIGSAYAGGFYAGDIGVGGVATHYLVVGPLSVGQAQTTLRWKNSITATPGADSNIDGPKNTADIVADGNSTVYPCAHFCNNAVIGNFSDWYMPAKNELEVCYSNLKPTTTTNNTSSGINPNAVPARASNYTSGDPAQTSAAAFQTGGTQAFGVSYWSSTGLSSPSAGHALYHRFDIGFSGNKSKYSLFLVRCIRRVPV